MPTKRQEIIASLSEGEHTARELSQLVGLREKEVVGHLSHVKRSLAAEGLELATAPAECLACGYVFRDRARYSRPSRCPRCRNERLTEPRYSIRKAGA